MSFHQPRIFYVGMVCTSAYVKAIREDGFVGAASGKMSSVVSALRLAGQRAYLVSLPFVGSGASRQLGRMCTDDGFPALFLPAWRSPAFRKVLGIFTMAWFAMRRVGPNDTILFYNHAPEYLLALLVLRLRGVPVLQDIEDVPTNEDQGLRGFLNQLSYGLLFKFSSPRKVTVSNQVGKTLHLRDFLPIQGIAAESVTAVHSEKWLLLEAGKPLRVHYGGTLITTTGLDLFCAALAQLDTVVEKAGVGIEFIVTGVGNMDRIREQASALRSDRLSIEVHQGVARDTYFNLLDSCHASLSLKSPESEISSTTFPSKVIEITSRGLALISTRVSDVGDIFTEDSAWLLPEFSAQALADVLLDMARNPAEARRRAEAGQALAQARFAPLAIGRALAEFLEAGP